MSRIRIGDYAGKRKTCQKKKEDGTKQWYPRNVSSIEEERKVWLVGDRKEVEKTIVSTLVYITGRSLLSHSSAKYLFKLYFFYRVLFMIWFMWEPLFPVRELVKREPLSEGMTCMLKQGILQGEERYFLRVWGFFPWRLSRTIKTKGTFKVNSKSGLWGVVQHFSVPHGSLKGCTALPPLWDARKAMSRDAYEPGWTTDCPQLGRAFWSVQRKIGKQNQCSASHKYT